jgi:hypothetical protein
MTFFNLIITFKILLELFRNSFGIKLKLIKLVAYILVLVFTEEIFGKM